MEGHNFSPRIVIVVSNDSFIYEALVDNINCKIELVDTGFKGYINSLGKVDVLIVDKLLSGHEIPIFRVEILINCTKNKLSQN